MVTVRSALREGTPVQAPGTGPAEGPHNPVPAAVHVLNVNRSPHDARAVAIGEVRSTLEVFSGLECTTASRVPFTFETDQVVAPSENIVAGAHTRVADEEPAGCRRIIDVGISVEGTRHAAFEPSPSHLFLPVTP